MPQSGIFLTTQDAEQISSDLLGIWYGLVIAGRGVTKEQIDRLNSYVLYFGGGANPTDTRADADTHWPNTSQE